MFHEFFPQESIFRDAAQSIHSSVFVVELNCLLDGIKELSTLEINFANESVVEKFMQKFHVLVVETEYIQFL